MTDRRQSPRQFLEPGFSTPFDQAHAVILPVPFEGTVSWGAGASRGPSAILEASEQLELYDEQLDAEPHRCGIWTEPPLAVERVAPEAMVAEVHRETGRLLEAGKWPVLLGGEHSITPGAVRATTERHPDLVVVQLDAHADLRESYQGQRNSHACAMARCLEWARVRAYGVRSYSREEKDRIAAGIPGYRITHAWEMQDDSWRATAFEGLAGLPVWLTVDLDVFDPAVIPATGTPEPGGLAWYPVLRLIERLFGTARVVGCDVVELAPSSELHHADFAAARLVYKLIGFACGAGSAPA